MYESTLKTNDKTAVTEVTAEVIYGPDVASTTSDGGEATSICVRDTRDARVCDARETPLVARLCEARWGVPAALREQLIARMAEVALTAKPRAAVAAFGALIQAEKLDLQALQVAVDAEAVRLQGDAMDDVRVERGLSEVELAGAVAGLLADAPPDAVDVPRRGVNLHEVTDEDQYERVG